MRVVIFTNSYKPTISGVVRSIDVFRKGLTEAGHGVYIVTPEHEDYALVHQ
jgi:1,2-diacylglycerol 3-alpha-glucosyltransferase